MAADSSTDLTVGVDLVMSIDVFTDLLVGHGIAVIIFIFPEGIFFPGS